MDIVSIIVPIYNMEKYLLRFLESLMAQTYEDYEVVLVDDGSNDKSIEICNQFAVSNSKIHIFRQPNNGVSSARNLGISVARGKYIYFADPDDILFESTIADLVNSMSSDSDLVMGGYEYIDEHEKKLDVIKFENRELTGDEAINGLHQISGYLWNKLFLKEIIDTYGIKFDESLIVSEDFLFVTEYLIHARKIRISEVVVYQYRLRSNSASNNHFNRNILSKSAALYKIYEVIPPSMKGARSRIFANYICSLINAVSKINYFNKTELFGIRDEYKKTITANRWRVLTNKDVDRSTKLKILIYSLHWRLYIYLWTRFSIEKYLQS